jgi:glycosyltransferase involved in cell wall biosynthesis
MAKKETKIFWHLHDPIHLGKQSFSRRILTRFQYGVVGKKARLLSVAEEYRQMVASLGFPESQTTTIVNGLDLERVSPMDAQREPEYDFLTFGWDFYRKGGDLILDACRLLADDGYVFKLLFNGNVHTWPKLKEYINGEEPAWLALGDPVENINELFEASRVFIQASRRETFSYAVCEAAYAGLPVISTDIAGLEWAHNLPIVDFVPGEDVRALYATMKGYLDGKTVSPEARDTSRRIIAREYSTERWTSQILNHYGV